MPEKFSLAKWKLLETKVILTFSGMSNQRRIKTALEIKEKKVTPDGLLVTGENKLSHVNAQALLAPAGKKSWIMYP